MTRPLDKLMQQMSELDARRREVAAEIHALREKDKSDRKAKSDAAKAQTREKTNSIIRAAAERRALALTLSLEGKTTAQVAEHFGVSRSRAAQLINGGRRDQRRQMQAANSTVNSVTLMPTEALTVTYKTRAGDLFVKDSNGNMRKIN